MPARYVISLLANLNARPRKKNILTDSSGNVATAGPSHVTTIAFAPRRRNDEDNQNSTIASHGLSVFLRSLRSIVHRERDDSQTQAADLEAQAQVDSTTTSAAEPFSEGAPAEK
jgi:hypothetical protein